MHNERIENICNNFPIRPISFFMQYHDFFFLLLSRPWHFSLFNGVFGRISISMLFVVFFFFISPYFLCSLSSLRASIPRNDFDFCRKRLEEKKERKKKWCSITVGYELVPANANQLRVIITLIICLKRKICTIQKKFTL